MKQLFLLAFLTSACATLPPGPVVPAPTPTNPALGVVGSYRGPLDAATLSTLATTNLTLRAGVATAQQAQQIVDSVKPYPSLHVLWLVEAADDSIVKAIEPIAQASLQTWGIELGNELDLGGLSSKQFGDWVLRNHTWLRAAGYTGRVVSGGIFAVQPETLKWLTDAGSQNWPADIIIAVHRYGDPDSSDKYTSRDAENQAILQATRGHQVVVTEFGYPTHTSADEAWAAEAVKRDISWFGKLAAPLITQYQLLDGPGTGNIDHFGIKTVDGRWKTGAATLGIMPRPPPTGVAADLVACKSPFIDNYCDGMPGAVFAIEVAPNVWKTYKGDGNGYAWAADLPNVPDSRITISAPGYFTLGPVHVDINHVPPIPTDLVAVNAAGIHNVWQLQAEPPPFPPPPTRQQALNVHITGQGLTVDTQQYGTLPWWEAALTYLTSTDRNAVYAAKHASTAWPSGDAHAIIAVPSGRALYDEPNQPYNATAFPPLDWTNGGTAMVPEFDALVIEVIRNGFVPMIFLDETMATSNKTLPVVIDALQHSALGDLTPYVIILPGWDGVFYGWEPSHEVIPAWAANARRQCPACYLGIEHNVGHIPLGEGDSDWTPTGLMKDFDLLLSEFWDGIFDDTVYQIAGRTIRPYHRPADQVGDPNPPMYMKGNLRDPNAQPACFFEFGMYGWVRGSSSAASIVQWRKRFKDLGYACGG
jgi:hypothetical protein